MTASKPPDNMRVWSAGEVTDPSYTKQVNQRGGFTAVDPLYNIKRATEVFGPLGHGWRFRVVAEGVEQVGDGVHWLRIEISTKDPKSGEWGEPFESYGATMLMYGNRPDEDARKKSLTDAIAKGLSMLGFSSDVYMGKFRDNKYAQEAAQHYQEKPAASPVRETPKRPESKGVMEEARDLILEWTGCPKSRFNVTAAKIKKAVGVNPTQKASEADYKLVIAYVKGKMDAEEAYEAE